TSIFTKGVKSCSSSGGECFDIDSCNDLKGQTINGNEYSESAVITSIPGTDCPEEQACCKIIYNPAEDTS
ncbi:MAG: hypothetical protein ACOC5T_06550, partial [Elusimicrobiota bacterium]